MSKTIGFDIGTNSIGYAIRDIREKEQQIIKSGVLIFEKGVAEEKGIEYPKVQKRTESRGKRRNYQAEKYRKWTLLEFLIKHNMCPLTIEELNQWRKYTKGSRRKYPQSEAFIQWLRFDFDGDGKPDFHLFNASKHENYFLFRAKAASTNPTDIMVFKETPELLGRIFYQLVQRRGFKGRDAEEAKTMLEGSDKNNTKGRNDIADDIKKYNTLGAALYYKHKETGERIRKRYNLRSDYENELIYLCKVHELPEVYYQKLWKAIIWQRPLRTQKGTIGTCTYEKNKKRAPLSHPLYEEYRTWIYINNLKIEPPVGITKKDYLQNTIYPLFLRNSELTVKTIRNRVTRDGGKLGASFKDKEKIVSAKLLNLFEILWGVDWKEEKGWHTSIMHRAAITRKKETKHYNYEDVWHVLQTFDSTEKLIEFAQQNLQLNEKQSNAFLKITLAKGYAPLSLSAIKKILPFLQEGVLYSHAVFLANLPKVLGTSLSNEEIIVYTQLLTDLQTKLKLQKQIAKTVNSLIEYELHQEDIYIIENNRGLKASDLKTVHQAINNNWTREEWNQLTDEEQNLISTTVTNGFYEFLCKDREERKDLSIVYWQVSNLRDAFIEKLKESYRFDIKRIKFLWHPSDQETYKEAQNYVEVSQPGGHFFIKEDQLDSYLTKNSKADSEGIVYKLLGSPEPMSKGLKNPMALKTLHKLKKLINYLIVTDQIAPDTRVVLEIARELNDTNKRKAIEKYQRERENENDSFRKIIDEYNDQYPEARLDRDNTMLLKKIRLWKEQEKQCLYTGKPICVSHLFNGVFDIEHTIPRSMSFDNENKNLTIADKAYNNFKGKRIPTQLPNYDTQANIEGEVYEAIKPRLSLFKDKINHHENLVKEYRYKTKLASTKEIKDNLIQKRHIEQLKLDYWRKKLNSFTLKEYKPHFKNSQLRDTQVITKYALPYLKTVFKKVSVEKGAVVNDFKAIYKIKSPDETKDRSKHTHHAIDAAILTLIPIAFYREQLLYKYNTAKENNKKFTTIPRDWKNFHRNYILGLENELLVNNLTEKRTLTQSYKKERKRGKLQYITYVDDKGQLHYKRDSQGDKTPKIQQGDTLRGQIHEESFYGAIKQPLLTEEGKFQFDEYNNIIIQDKVDLVIRRELVYKKDANSSGFTTLKEIEDVIVDKSLFQQIEQQVLAFNSLKEALANGIYMLDKKGNKVNQVRRIRCKVKGLKYESAIKFGELDFASKHTYKQHKIAKNGENPYCLYYIASIGKKEERFIKIISIYELSKLKSIIPNFNIHSFYELPSYKNLTVQKGKKQIEASLYHILEGGMKVVFYKEHIEELKELKKQELSKQLYKIYGFEADGRIKLKHHLIAGADTDIKKQYKEASSINFNTYQPLLRITKKQWNFALESKHFTMALDGTMTWLF